MTIEKTIGKKIKEVRKSRNMTISDLSKLTMISTSQLSRIECGNTSSPVSTLDNIAKALGTKIGFLFANAEDMNDPRFVLTKGNKRNNFRKGMAEFGYNYSAIAPQKKNKMMEPFVLKIDRSKSSRGINAG